MTNGAVDAVIFDWGGTITPWHDIDSVAEWAAVVSDDDTARRLREATASVWLRSRDEHRSATIAEVFALAEVQHTDQMLADYYAWWEPHTFADPDAPALFAGLRELGIKVGVLSNTLWPRSEHERVFARDGLTDLIDGAVYTSDLAWTKPHPEAFRAALDAVGVGDPTRAVFVGDRPFEDIHGAAEVGMRTILVPHSNIPVEQVGHTEGDPDAVAHRLSDVLGIVRSWSDSVAAGEHA